ncbi:MAG: YceI family protein, partial [Pseudomonadota bacterium]
MRLAALAFGTAIAAASLGSPTAALAADPYVLDRSHTAITFQVSHLGFSTTHGVFREVNAEINFDPKAVEATTVMFV